MELKYKIFLQWKNVKSKKKVKGFELCINVYLIWFCKII